MEGPHGENTHPCTPVVLVRLQGCCRSEALFQGRGEHKRNGPCWYEIPTACVNQGLILAAREGSARSTRRAQAWRALLVRTRLREPALELRRVCLYPLRFGLSAGSPSPLFVCSRVCSLSVFT